MPGKLAALLFARPSSGAFCCAAKIEKMENKRQFSLAYLFLEVFWIAVGLGIAIQIHQMSRESNLWPALLYLDIIVWGAAIGGLFKRMEAGAVISLVGLLVFTVVFGLFPSVQT